MQADRTQGKMDIAVFGCGGTGTEVIKLLKNHNLTVVDFDRIELSNLNRQFLYTRKDRGEYKSRIAGLRTGCSYLVSRVEDIMPVFLDSFSAVFSCLDSVSSRMELNYLFRQSAAPLLIDCGVEGLKAHAKAVDRRGACLYCMKDLYTAPDDPHLCSLAGAGQEVTASNREKVLVSLIFKEKEGGAADEKQMIADIEGRFNSLAPQDLRTSSFEIYGYLHRTVPNVCTINSICASMAVCLLLRPRDYDFVFYDGACAPSFRKIKLERDPACIVCGNGSG